MQVGANLKSNHFGFWGWLGVTVLAGLFVFKLVPEWTKTPETSQDDVIEEETYDFEDTPELAPDSSIQEPSSASSESYSTSPAPEPESTPINTTSPSIESVPSQSIPAIKTNGCLHQEAGRCWDGLEDEAYSKGLYDKMYGYYGASVYYGSDCDAVCQDILDDAYDEGYYENF